MKKLIRDSVFETNSSSCHSLSIGGKAGLDVVYDTISPNELGNIILTGGQYGRSFYKTNDPMEKANYLAVATLYGYNKKDLIECIKEHTQCENVILEVSDEYSSSSWSYIDHESTGNTPDKEDMKEFIFSKNSWLYIAHDEASPPIDFYKNDVYNEDGSIEKLKQPYELVVYNKDGDEIDELNFKSSEKITTDVVRTQFSELRPRFVNGENKFEVNSDSWSGQNTYFTFFHMDGNYLYFGKEMSYSNIPDHIRKLPWRKQDEWTDREKLKKENHIKLKYKIIEHD